LGRTLQKRWFGLSKASSLGQEEEYTDVVNVGVGLSRGMKSFESAEVSQRPENLLGRSSELGSKRSLIFQSPSAITTVTVEICKRIGQTWFSGTVLGSKRKRLTFMSTAVEDSTTPEKTTVSSFLQRRLADTDGESSLTS